MAGYQYTPAPGPQNPGRYPVAVGPNYLKYGEQKGWIYNPYTDRYTPDPNAVKDLQIAQGVRQPDPKKPSLSDTLVPVAAVGGTLIASQELGKEIPGLIKDAGSGIKDAASGLFGGGSPTAATSATKGATDGLVAVGTNADGTIMYAPESLAGEAGTGLFDLAGIGAEGNAILPVAGAVGAFDVLSHDYGTGRSTIEGAASGAAIGSYFGPQGAVIGGVIGGGVGLAKSLFGSHKSTKKYQKEKWGALAKSEDPATAQYAQQYLEYLNSDQAKEDAKKDFNQLRRDGLLTDEDVWGSLDMFKAFPGWLTNYTEQQRRDISKALISADAFKSEKGDIHLVDVKKAQEIGQQAISGKPAAPAQNQSTESSGMFNNEKPAAPAQPSATSTPEPIDKLSPQQVVQTGQAAAAQQPADSGSGMFGEQQPRSTKVGGSTLQVPGTPQAPTLQPLLDGSGRYVDLRTGQIVQGAAA